MATGDWIPEADVLAHFKVSEGSDNAPSVKSARRAAVVLVERERRDLELDTLEVPVDPVERAAALAAYADVIEGTLLLIGRLHARRGTPEGIATFGELGAAMILRSDPDISLMLGIGRYGKPGLA